MAWQAAAIAAGANLVGSVYQQKQARKRANEQMAFQERMSNTAYQRAMADMRRAGINPIMVSKLGGASTPTGAMAPTPDFTQIGSKAMQAYSTAQQVKLMNAQTNNTNEQAKVHSTTADLNSAKSLTEHQKAKTEQYIQQLKRAEITSKRIANSMSQFEYTYFKKLGYPPKVLTARVENVVGTYLWENLPESKKVDFTRFVYDQIGKLGSKVKEFTDTPDTWLQKWWKLYSGMNLHSLYTKGIPDVR